MVWIADHVQQIEASPEDVGLSSAGMARLTRHIQAYVDAGKFPGAISMVQRRARWCISRPMACATWRRARRSSATRSSASTP